MPISSLLVKFQLRNSSACVALMHIMARCILRLEEQTKEPWISVNSEFNSNIFILYSNRVKKPVEFVSLFVIWLVCRQHFRIQYCMDGLTRLFVTNSKAFSGEFPRKLLSVTNNSFDSRSAVEDNVGNKSSAQVARSRSRTDAVLHNWNLVLSKILKHYILFEQPQNDEGLQIRTKSSKILHMKAIL